ncbi:hypothetical protein PENTCL1PPCAC_15141, partial [Pristionchus entomophagus]
TALFQLLCVGRLNFQDAQILRFWQKELSRLGLEIDNLSWTRGDLEMLDSCSDTEEDLDPSEPLSDANSLPDRERNCDLHEVLSQRFSILSNVSLGSEHF